jgi:two-component system, NtrC family, response regulator AtoC
MIVNKGVLTFILPRAKTMNNSHTSKILVAEDNEDSRLMLRAFLETLGYEVIEAGNGEEAVRLARQEEPDLILMDLNMPVLDGVTAAMTIRQLAQLSDIPIIANSAEGGYGIDLFLNIRQMGEGYIGYITKPINLDDLAEQMKAALLRVRRAA